MASKVDRTAEVDDGENRGIEDSSSLNSASIASSVLEYRYSNGRRYHSERTGEYLVPNDETEQDRMDLLHHIWTAILGGELLLTQVKQPGRVLDVGTGTGLWAVQFADENPDAEVVGIDLSPIQPGWVPPNVDFYVEDAESEWSFQPFDLIHVRSLMGSFADWIAFYRKAFENLKSGGSIEIKEHSAWMRSLKDEPPAVHEWNLTVAKASEIFGKKYDVAHLHKAWLEEAGFVDVQERVHELPVGTWAKGNEQKDLGRFHLVQMLGAVDAYTLGLYTQVLGMTVDEWKATTTKIKDELLDNSNQLLVNYHVITARKP